MAIKTPPYLQWREGRPRWEPGPRLRAAGWRGRDLRTEHGDWLPLGRAIEAAEALNREVAASKAAGANQQPPPPPKPGITRTLGVLHQRWTASPEFRALADKTRRDYAIKAAVFLDDMGRDSMVAALSRRTLKAYWRQLFDARGHAMANGVLAVARAILTFACDEEWIAVNPAFALKLLTVPPRIVVWSPSEVEAAVATADRLGLSGLGDAIVIALHTGQRQGDVLSLEDPRVEGGRARFRQSKTGAQVAVPFTEQLAARLDAVRARRRALSGVIALDRARRVVLPPDGREYSGDRLRKDFQIVRDAVARDLPGFAAKTFADLRDTAITRLALAECTVAEIRAITGHSLETVHSVLKHYLALDDRMAASAISKLQAWMEKEEIKI